MQRQALVALHRRLGWSQAKLAEHLNILPQTLYKMEVGLRPIPPPIDGKVEALRQELARARRARPERAPFILEAQQRRDRVEADRLRDEEELAQLELPLPALKTA